MNNSKRMDRYKDFDEQEELYDEENKVLSREEKNQDMYKDVYLNNTIVDINNIFGKSEDESVIEETENINKIEVYEEKSYDINAYIEASREKHTNDNAKRSLEDTDFINTEGEIKKLIATIEEKEQEEDIFNNLRGDNEDTMIGGKLKTDEFDIDIYNALKDNDTQDGNIIFNRGLGDKTVHELELAEDEKLDYTFQKIFESDQKEVAKRNKLPLIIFSITLFILIIVILIVIFK